MKNTIKYLSALDWLVAALTIIYGSLVGPNWLIATGCVSLVVAWFKPAVYIEKKITERFLKKKPKDENEYDKESEDYYASILVAPLEGVGSETATSNPELQPNTASVPFKLMVNKHNQLKYSHFNLYSKTDEGRKF